METHRWKFTRIQIYDIPNNDKIWFHTEPRAIDFSKKWNLSHFHLYSRCLVGVRKFIYSGVTALLVRPRCVLLTSNLISTKTCGTQHPPSVAQQSWLSHGFLNSCPPLFSTSGTISPIPTTKICHFVYHKSQQRPQYHPNVSINILRLNFKFFGYI